MMGASMTPLLSSSLSAMATGNKSGRVFVGTYTQSGSQGIYSYHFDAAAGKLEQQALAAETRNPTFLAFSPNRKFLYAVNEIANYEGTKDGSLTAFAIEESGALRKLNTVSSGGGGPCHIAVDHTGHCLFAANYGTGSASSFLIETDGSIGKMASFFQHKGHGPNPHRQEGPHAHAPLVSPDNRFVLVHDLGLDRIVVYRLDPHTAKLTLNNPPYWESKPGAGPRHMVFHPNGKWAYSGNEMGNTVDVLAWTAANGSLKTVQTLPTLAADFKGSSTVAEVVLDHAGKFLYVSNRGEDTVALFAIDGQHGTLTPVDRTPTGGKVPRHFTIDPSGKWLLAANQDSNNIVVFRRDPSSGRLTANGQESSVGAPVCVLFV